VQSEPNAEPHPASRAIDPVDRQAREHGWEGAGQQHGEPPAFSEWLPHHRVFIGEFSTAETVICML
jgi:hypothetical protein